MSLSADSDPCVSSDWLIFLLIRGHIFLLFANLVIFYWKPDVVNFTLLGAGYFCISVNILCFGMWLRYFEAVWFFWVWLLRFVTQDRSRAQYRANRSPWQRHMPSMHSGLCLRGNRDFFPIAVAVGLAHMHWSVFHQVLRRTPCVFLCSSPFSDILILFYFIYLLTSSHFYMGRM